jgi:hypothetical protein
MNTSLVIYFMRMTLTWNRIQTPKTMILVRKETQCTGGKLFEQGQDRFIVNTTIYLQILQRKENILTRWSNISFSRKAAINWLVSQIYKYGLQRGISILLNFFCSSHRNSMLNYFKHYRNSFVEFVRGFYGRTKSPQNPFCGLSFVNIPCQA